MKKLLSIILYCIFVPAITLVGVGRLHAQDHSQESRSLRALTVYLGGKDTQEGIIKCGFSTIATAWSVRDTLRADMKVNLDQVLQRPPTQASIVIGSFRIHYDTVGINTPVILDSARHPLPGGYRAFVDSVGATANYVLGYETGVLGYLPPPPDNGAGGGNEYDIYISNLGFSYGYTDPETEVVHKPNGSTWTSFVVVDNDFEFVSPRRNIGLPALRVTMAHEFHHAIQMGCYGYWSGHEYFYEITSTWMEDVLYTEVNDYLQYLSANFARPEEPFTKFEMGGTIQYSRCVWGHYMSKKFGRDVMRQAWLEIQNVVPLQAMDNALQTVPYASSFRLAFAEWSKWNFFTGSRADTALYYPEGNSYPSVSPVVIGFGGIEGSLPFLSSRYYRVLIDQTSFTLGLTNINLDAALANNTTQFPYRYLMSSQQLDNSYRRVAEGAYVKLDVPDRGNWYDWSLGSLIEQGVVFPNPFIVDGAKPVSIAVNSFTQTEGTLSVFTSSMDLVFSSSVRSTTHLSGQQVFTWNGRTINGEIVRTGIYFFVLEVADQVLQGKIAVVRK